MCKKYRSAQAHLPNSQEVKKLKSTHFTSVTSHSVVFFLSGSKTYILCQSLKEGRKNMKKKEDDEEIERNRAIFFLTI